MEAKTSEGESNYPGSSMAYPPEGKRSGSTAEDGPLGRRCQSKEIPIHLAARLINVNFYPDHYDPD
jgi:hypothetical protein